MTIFDFNKDWMFNKEGSEDIQKVTLPHDAMIHEDRGQSSPGGSAVGFFMPGKYRYVKIFEKPKGWDGLTVLLAFGGVYRKAEVFVNGQKAAYQSYGYTSFEVDITDYLKDGENSILVTADNSKMPNSRWYTGAGIYRPVYAVVGYSSNHINFEGVRVSTLEYSPAKIRVQTNAVHTKDVTVKVEVSDLYKDEIYTAEGEDVEIEMPGAKLWSDKSPNLYRASVQLVDKDDRVLDSDTTLFGIRKVEWSTKGFFVNGEETLLRGGCVHHDNGILGACEYQEAANRKVRILKENGFNAIRSAHNPISREMLNACDRFGMYVMDETFDMWYRPKTRYDYSWEFETYWKEDVKAVVKKDFSHPSVIMYSIGNEVSEPASEMGVEYAKAQRDLFHELDPSRPVTAGANLLILGAGGLGIDVMATAGDATGKTTGGEELPSSAVGDFTSGSLLFNNLYQKAGPVMNYMPAIPFIDKVISPFLDSLDIAGYNYGRGRYELEGKQHPNRIVVGSETLPQEIGKNWEKVKELPYVIGDFMWTGWDYIGEAGFGAWNYDKSSIIDIKYPWLLNGSGAVDITGHPGCAAGLASVVWRMTDTPFVGVRPINHMGTLSASMWRGSNAVDSWSWRGCDYMSATVEVYTSGAFVRLIMNGEPVGIKRVHDYKAVFNIRYEPGTLSAVCYDQTFREYSGKTLQSAEGPISIHIDSEREAALPGEVVFAEITLQGENGVVESNDDTRLRVTVENCELLGFGSAEPETTERYDSGVFTTQYGRALACVRMGEKGSAIIYAEPDCVDPKEGVKKVIRIL